MSHISSSSSPSYPPSPFRHNNDETEDGAIGPPGSISPSEESQESQSLPGPARRTHGQGPTDAHIPPIPSAPLNGVPSRFAPARHQGHPQGYPRGYPQDYFTREPYFHSRYQGSQMLPHYYNDYRNAPHAPPPDGSYLTERLVDLGPYSSRPYTYNVPPPPPSEIPAPASAPASPPKPRPGGNTRREPLSLMACDAVIWNPSSQRDMTIHLELEIEEDIEGKVKTLAYLRRMGRFRDANDFVRDNLWDHLQDLTVALEYADMLLAQGNFGRIFESFDDEDITRLCARSWAAISTDQLAATWGKLVSLLLTLHLARSYSDPDLHSAREAARLAFAFLQARKKKHEHCFTPTELQILCRYLTLISYIRGNSNFVTETDFDMSAWPQWPGLYRNLVEENRHWDLRDAVVASVTAFGPLKTCENFFGDDSLATGVSKLLSDWETMPPDETSDPCLLEILVCLGKEAVMILGKSGNKVAGFENVFKQARAVATSMKEKNVQTINCRPYLEWILVEEERSRILGSLQGEGEATTLGLAPPFFKWLPGLTVWFGVLPIYVPSVSETPGWPVSGPLGSATSRHPKALLTVVLKASEDLDDFSTQASCLQELICHSPDPASVFTDLDHLQRSVMGDKLGAFKTRLSKYLLADNQESRQLLKKELVEMNPRLPLWRHFVHPMVEWCHGRVLHALALAVDGDSEETRRLDGLANAVNHLLPDYLLPKLDTLKTNPPAPYPAASRGTEPAPPPGPSDAGFRPPHIPPSPSPPPPPVTPDPEIERLKMKLNLVREKQQLTREARELERLKEQLRKDVEEATSRQMDQMQRAQEEAIKAFDRARLEVERAARERLEKETKAEEERKKMQEALMIRIEHETREKIKAELKADQERSRREQEAQALTAAQIEARIKLAMKEAEERRAAEKAAEDAEWRSRLDRVMEEAKAKAETEARAQMEAERKATETRIAEAVALAVAKTTGQMRAQGNTTELDEKGDSLL